MSCNYDTIYNFHGDATPDDATTKKRKEKKREGSFLQFAAYDTEKEPLSFFLLQPYIFM
jgi:hypothetical protein